MARGFGITIDCADPPGLAVFWRQVLDYVDDPPPTGYATWAEYDAANGVSDEESSAGAAIIDPEGVGPRFYFQRVPEAKKVKNRVHLDVQSRLDQPDPATDTAEARNAARQRLRSETESLGARFVREPDDPNDRFIVMTDPEGNEFCIA